MSDFIQRGTRILLYFAHIFLIENVTCRIQSSEVFFYIKFYCIVGYKIVKVEFNLGKMSFIDSSTGIYGCPLAYPLISPNLSFLFTKLSLHKITS